MTVVIEPGALGTTGANLLYRNLLLEGTVTVSSETVDGQVENAFSGETWDYWKPTVGASYITLDLGTARTCDGFGISAHNGGTVGAVYVLARSPDGVNWPDVTSYTPTNNSAIFFAFPPTTSRYWRFICEQNAASIGVLILGERLKFPSGVLTGHTSMHNAKRSKLMNTTTVSGHHRNNRITRIGIEGKVDFGLVDTSFGDGAFQEFKDHYNGGKIFFYAGSPSNYPKDTALCWRPESAGDITPSYQEGGALMDLSMEVSAFVDT